MASKFGVPDSTLLFSISSQMRAMSDLKNRTENGYPSTKKIMRGASDARRLQG